MKKTNLLLLVLTILAFALVSCEKEEKPTGGDVNDTTTNTDPVNPIDTFCGTYNLTIVCDSVQNNGTWFSNSALPASARIPERSGRLTITKSQTAGVVNVLGRIKIANDSVDFYNTTGMIDSQGRLQLESGQDFQGTYHSNHFTFAPISEGATLVFKTDASYVFNGTNFIERYTNTAEKR